MLRFNINSWFGRLLYRLEWAFNQGHLALPSYAPCSRCTWAFPRSKLNFDGLCSGCAAWAEEEARREQEYVEAWAEYERDLEGEERRIREETDQAWRERRSQTRKEDEKAFREAQSKGLL